MVSDATINEAPESAAVDPQATTSKAGRVLYLVHRTPFPPNRGDRIRSYHMLRYLANRFQLYLAALSDEPVPDEHRRILREMCAETCILRQPSVGRWGRAAFSFSCGRTATQGLFWSPALASVVRQWSQTVGFDAIIACCSSMGQYLLLPELSATRSIVDLIDVDSQKWLDYASSSSGVKAKLYHREGMRLRDLEAKLTKHVEAVLLVNDEEAKLFRSVVPNEKTLAIANGVDVDYFSSRDESPPEAFDCVFVGVLDYRPNVDGLRWFCDNVWPRVREQLPEATLTIVGRRPAEPVTQLGQLPGVRVMGEVPDVRPYVARATVSIAPLQIARGTQNKVLEAMAMGKPVVATSLALEGIDATSHIDVLQANSAAEWVKGLTRLADDVQLRLRLGSNARDFVRNHHDWSACLEPVGDLVSRFVVSARTDPDQASR